MLDLLLILEVAWCSRWLRASGPREALIRSGAILASGFAGANLSDWMARVLVPPAVPVLRWVEARVSLDAGAIPALAAFVPPETAAWTDTVQVQWIAYHVTQTLLFAGITAGVIAFFAVMNRLSDALWDPVSTATRRLDGWIAPAAALLSSVYLALLTATVFAQLAWLRPFAWVIGEARKSVAVHVAGWLVHCTL
ncbi:MAG: hypothetical protein IRZ33_01080 [Alicyclobacillaceae bacterium]|nr:hypothetical protein [Alicyclobacillaceae bacterium]